MPGKLAYPLLSPEERPRTERASSPPTYPLSLELGPRGNTVTFNFLNQPVHFSSFEAINWNYAANGKLWTYNLNYFEYLRQPSLDPTTGQALIDSWIVAEPTHKDGWEPYPISLRLVNWLHFYRNAESVVPDKVQASIYRQYAALSRKREFHLGGNHLLENAIALALTSRYFHDETGRKKADKLLLAELKEQYLPDGAHYERSIMYHLILLWRQLDLYAWVGAFEGWNEQWEVAQPSPVFTALRSTLQKQLAWANRMITPDGRYPHFNDSTDGIAPDWPAVQTYAKALGLKMPADNLPATGQGAGYRHWSVNGLNLWIDAGAIGPDYIPGHAHADNLSFVLHLNGKPIIIDPAISTYEKNARRAWERSTLAHNTVTINDNQNSSDVWGGFRVGKRAQTTIKTDDKHRLTATHNGFRGTVHSRHFSLDEQTGRLAIYDILTGAVENGTARLHFAPSQKLVIDGHQIITEDCRMVVEGATSITVFDYQMAGGWNYLLEAKGVEIHFQASLTVEILPLRSNS